MTDRKEPKEIDPAPNARQWEVLSTVREKQKVFSKDLYFRESWADMVSVFGSQLMNILGSVALLSVKPDAVVGRRMTDILQFVADRDFLPIAVCPFQLTRHSMRELWRYDWYVYPVDRLNFSTFWYTATEVLMFILQDRQSSGSASVRLSQSKGLAEPERRTANHLRTILRPPNRVLNFVHVADEPADVVRELGIFFDRDERKALLKEIERNLGLDRHRQALYHIARLEARYPEHDLDFSKSLKRLEESAVISSATAEHLRALLDNVEGLNWDELKSIIDPTDPHINTWDFICVAANVIARERDLSCDIFPSVTFDGASSLRQDASSGAPFDFTQSIRHASVLRLVEPEDRFTMLDQLVKGPEVWYRDTLCSSNWIEKLPAQARAEIDTMIATMREAPLPLMLRQPDDFRIPACRDFMATVKQILIKGTGLVFVDIPIEGISADEAATVFWILGHSLALPVATKWDGTMLYDVTDAGRAFGYGVRGSATNRILPFHTDNAFGVALPDYVGLLCLNPAQTGGVNRFCSLYAVHNEMLDRHRDLLRRLYEPCYYDRQAEHAPEAPKVLQVPMFRYQGNQLQARFTPNLIRSGYEMVGEPMDRALIEALDCIEGFLADERFWIEVKIRRGQICYLNNHWCAHYRGAFVDSDDTGGKRHLIRAWYREQGEKTYDG